MIRNVDINDISDGKLYSSNDMVKISCNDCKGCSKCCHDMGDSINLDPYDIYMLSKGLNKSFTELLEDALELHLVDDNICPHIKMQPDTKGCIFLNENERCSVHEYRPGYCRLFPLGRIYEGNDFAYFNQIYECDYPAKSKIKIKKWLSIPALSEYEEYIKIWHSFQKKISELLAEESDNYKKQLHMFILNTFYVKEYDTEASFYPQFKERMETIKTMIPTLSI